MSVPIFTPVIRRMARLQSGSIHPRLQTMDDFHNAVARARSGADRAGHEFSLVVFSFRNGTASTIRFLAREAIRRIRSIDEIGWYDERSIGVLLPFTPKQGAKKVAMLIAHAADSDPAQFWYLIYSYPSRCLIEPDGVEKQTDLKHSFAWPQDTSSLELGAAVNPDQNGRDKPFEPTPPSHHSRFKRESVETVLSQKEPTWKRVMDIMGATVGLIAFAPLMLVTALSIKLTSKGPVLFNQQRVGLGMKPFTFYKFRSMDQEQNKNTIVLDKSNESGPFVLKKSENDPRITPVGRFIRKWSVDELPQLWSVLKGDMALVGPRPLILAEALECEDWHSTRFDVKPGLTCLWQVYGRSRVTAEERSRMDLRYIVTLSFALDIKILLMTPIAVLTAKGAY